MSKKIAVLITDEFEDSEFTSPADEFRKAGHEVITIEKQAGKTVKGKKGEASVTIDKSIDEVTPAEFDALLLPGGHSPDYLRGDNRFVTFTRDFVNSGKPVFAICHGPQLLISADVIRGRKLTAVKPIIIDVKNAGAEFYDQEVVVDKDQLVTNGHRTICQRLTARRYACSVPESRSQIIFLPKPSVLSVNLISSSRISHTGADSILATGKRRLYALRARSLSSPSSLRISPLNCTPRINATVFG